MKVKKRWSSKGASPDPAFLKVHLVMNWARFHKNDCIGGPHNLVCPGAPTSL